MRSIIAGSVAAAIVLVAAGCASPGADAPTAPGSPASLADLPTPSPAGEVLATRDRTLAAVVWVEDGEVTVVAGALDTDEVSWLGEVISSHAKLTGSRIAAALLADWPFAAIRFSRVMPRDYRKILSIRAEAAALGVDADEMIMEASHG